MHPFRRRFCLSLYRYTQNRRLLHFGGGARDVMVIAVGNGLCDTSSNPGQG